jgi:hypothetical protein
MNVTLSQSAITTAIAFNTTAVSTLTTNAATTVSSSSKIQAVQVISKYNTPFITDYNNLSSSASLAFISNYKAFVNLN